MSELLLTGLASTLCQLYEERAIMYEPSEINFASYIVLAKVILSTIKKGGRGFVNVERFK